ncbi:acyl-CoA dehydrogenase, partial [candidate division WOR-3 bacterium]|nr:acyl-CoA dehydrogenase [candidate division WOR-3 bacterium]
MEFNFSEDAGMVRQTVHEFVRRDLLPKEHAFLNARTSEDREALSVAATDALKEMGMYSAAVPEKFGGGGLGPIEACIIAEELAHTVIPVEWGDLTPILYECSDAQKEKYLVPVVQGEKTYALAFREKADSPEEPMQTGAHQAADGYVLNGTKLLSRAGYDFCLVFAQTGEGLSCFILDADAPGATARGEGDGAELVLKDCKVAPERLLGEPGKALLLGREWFGLTRITRAAAILGVCDRVLEVTSQYAGDWTQLQEHISDRKSIQQALAEMAGDVEALRWLVYRAAWLAAEGRKHGYDSMLVKLQAQKVLTDTVNRSVRIHGGTNPPFEHWLIKSSGEGEALDLLRLAVAQQTIASYT